jgi:predicted nucleic acid-binding protein
MVAMTLDSGALIAYERGDARVRAHLELAFRNDIVPVVPAIALAEAWRGGPRSARIAALLRACAVHPLTEGLARRAGEALARISGATVADACIVASAAERGGAVLTSDPKDIARLVGVLAPSLRVLTV